MPDLGIDTASDDASVAILEGDRVLAERHWHIDTNASRELLANIQAVLREAGVARTALTGVAVNVGPGGYGSLRAGVATAQGIALALDVPLAGVDRLEVQAFPHLEPDGTVIAVHEAGNGQLAWAAYGACVLIDDAQGAPPEVRVATRLDTPPDCLLRAPTPARWCGDLAAVRAMRDTAGRVGDIDVSDATNTRSASDVVRLARLHRAFGDPAAVDVTYLRAPHIGLPAAEAR